MQSLQLLSCSSTLLLRQNERIQSAATSCEYVLPAVQFISDRRVAHAPNAGMPQRGSILSPKCKDVAGHVAGECDTGLGCKDAGRACVVADVVTPSDFAGLIIDGA